jgi:hypothetical protein
MGFEQFDYLDEQAIAMTAIQTGISTGITEAVTNIDATDINVIINMLDGDDIEGVKTALSALQTNLVLLKTSLETVNAANNQAKTIVAALRPMIFAEKEKIIGDGKTWHDYICRACSVQCPASFR